VALTLQTNNPIQGDKKARHPPKGISLRKHELAIRLQTIDSHPSAKLHLEQYTIPADVAAEILFLACYVYGDVEGRSVVDLGTGTGRLAIGAAALGAKWTVGIDVDKDSVRAAWNHLRATNVDWVAGNLHALRGRFDTVLMNPPFGTRKPHSDMQFLEAAMSLGDVVYSIHKTTTEHYVRMWLETRESPYEIIMTTTMNIGHQFDFHRKSAYPVAVQVYRIESTKT
jgi:putative methylase